MKIVIHTKLSDLVKTTRDRLAANPEKWVKVSEHYWMRLNKADQVVDWSEETGGAK